MSAVLVDSIFEDALELRPFDKAKLVDKLLATLDESDEEIDELWAKEVEDRIDAYDRGEIESVPVEDVLGKYGRK